MDNQIFAFGILVLGIALALLVGCWPKIQAQMDKPSDKVPLQFVAEPEWVWYGCKKEGRSKKRLTAESVCLVHKLYGDLIRVDIAVEHKACGGGSFWFAYDSSVDYAVDSQKRLLTLQDCQGIRRVLKYQNGTKRWPYEIRPGEALRFSLYFYQTESPPKRLVLYFERFDPLQLHFS